MSASYRSAPLENLNILVVEDHEFQRAMLIRMLHGLGIENVREAADGVAALEVLKTSRVAPDVVITDLDMPKMDGMELIRHLGSGWNGIAVILTTAHDRPLTASVEVMASAYGVRLLATIEKPVTAGKLTDVLDSSWNVHPRPAVAAVAASPPAFTVEEILDGLRSDEFEAYFQPKINLASGRIAGAEALARWRHPSFGLVSPASFITTLERNGRIDALLRCMLIKSTDFCARMKEAGLETTAAVNVSVESLARPSGADEITEIVRGRGVRPESLIIEVTESGATADVGQMLENLTRLRMRGFGLSIDDYGTGYSSMKQLTRVPFTELKIDQSFITHAAELDSARLILGSSLDLARKLNITAVAEGVETRANWDLLRDLQCELVQGYYIAKPMAPALYLKWAKTWPLMSGQT